MNKKIMIVLYFEPPSYRARPLHVPRLSVSQMSAMLATAGHVLLDVVELDDDGTHVALHPHNFETLHPMCVVMRADGGDVAADYDVLSRAPLLFNDLPYLPLSVIDGVDNEQQRKYKKTKARPKRGRTRFYYRRTQW